MTSFVEAARREKLAELIKRGVAAFAYRFDRTGTARGALDGYRDGDATVHRLAGRLVLLRPMGKTTFGHLEDASGKIQLYFKIDALGADQYEVVKLLDLGDVIGVEGPLFRTKTGEVTVRVERLTLLAKSLRPLPLGKEDASGVRHGELSDPELRARQRYADLAVHPDVREIFRLRAGVVSYVRRFLDARGYLEVETPVLQPLYGGATARPFKTHYEALDATFYLRIADELYLKRCIVGGLEKVYEIGHDFRNEGLSRFHNPEFTMAEWYQAYADYGVMRDLTEEMLAGLVADLFGTTTLERHGATLSFARPFASKDYHTLVRETAGLDLAHATEAELQAALSARTSPTLTRSRGRSSSTRSSRTSSSRPWCSRPSCSIIRSRCRRSRSSSAAMRRASSAGSCSSRSERSRTRSASSTIPRSSAAASSSRRGCAPPATRRRSSSTRTFCARSSMACPPPAAWGWGSTGCL